MFVFGPELAMLSTPRPLCVRFGLNSSLKASPQTDLPPRPVPSGSPPCICTATTLGDDPGLGAVAPLASCPINAWALPAHPYDT